MELPAAIVFGGCFLASSKISTPVLWVFLGLWELHYTYRAVIFPLLRRSGSKPMPVIVVFCAIIFNVFNGYFNGRGIFTFNTYDVEWLGNRFFRIGTIMFLAGFVMHVHSDWVLIALRKPKETGYRIPQRGLHRWISAPNYLGEMIQWIGWTLATSCLPALAFAAWTAANLVPRALAHHAWYRRNFTDYPSNRRALIPFMW